MKSITLNIINKHTGEDVGTIDKFWLDEDEKENMLLKIKDVVYTSFEHSYDNIEQILGKPTLSIVFGENGMKTPNGWIFSLRPTNSEKIVKICIANDIYLNELSIVRILKESLTKTETMILMYFLSNLLMKNGDYAVAGDIRYKDFTKQEKAFEGLGDFHD